MAESEEQRAAATFREQVRPVVDEIFAHADELEAATKRLAADDAGRVVEAQATILDDLNEIRHALGTIEATAAAPGAPPPDDPRASGRGGPS
jgi:hypothetical protein